MNYEGRRFRSVSNAASGDVGAETVFEYHQEGEVVWATYQGGSVRFGSLVALVGADGSLDMRYQHVGEDGLLKTGVCHSTPEVLDDGRIRLHESWHWTSGVAGSGESVVEEFLPSDESL